MMVSTTAWLDHARAAAERLRRAFDARARRERLLLIGAGIAVVWMLADNLWLTPAFKDWSAARSRSATAVAALQSLNDDIARRGDETRRVEQQLRGDVAQWRERVVQGDAALRAFGATLVSASDMVPMLDALLVQVGGLRMRSMQSLGRTEVGARAATASATAESKDEGALFRHGVELTVEGGYADVVTYLRAIEAMPQHVLWGDMSLKVDQYP